MNHLLMRGFMDGHTQWISVDEDDEVHEGNDQDHQGHENTNNNEWQENKEFDPAHDGGGAVEENVTEHEDTQTPLSEVV